MGQKKPPSVAIFSERRAGHDGAKKCAALARESERRPRRYYDTMASGLSRRCAMSPRATMMVEEGRRAARDDAR